MGDNWNTNANQNNNQNSQSKNSSSPMAGVDSRLSQVQIGNKRKLNSPIDNVKKLKREDGGVSGSNTPTDDNSITKEALRKVLRHPMESKKLLKKLASKYPKKDKKEVSEELTVLLTAFCAKKPVDGRILWQWKGN